MSKQKMTAKQVGKLKAKTGSIVAQSRRNETEGAAAVTGALVLVIGSAATVECSDAEHAQREYLRIRNESKGATAGTFPGGKLMRGDTEVGSIAFNGTLWDTKGAMIATKPVPTPKELAAPAKPAEQQELAPAESVSVPTRFLAAAALIAPKKDESRPMVCGVYVHRVNDELRVVATDGSRLVVLSTRNVECIDWAVKGVIIPLDKLDRVLKFAKDSAQVVLSFGADHQHACIVDEANDAVFKFSPLEGQFPGYYGVMERAAAVLTEERVPTETASLDPKLLKSATGIASALGATGVRPFMGGEASTAPSMFTFVGEPGAVLYIAPQGQSTPALEATTVRMIGTGGVEAVIAKIKEEIRRSEDNAKRTKIKKFADQSIARVAKLQARLDHLKAAISVKLTHVPAAAPAEATEAAEPAEA